MTKRVKVGSGGVEPLGQNHVRNLPVKLPNKPPKHANSMGTKSGKGQAKYYGGYGGYKGVKVSDAVALANAQINESLKDLQRQRRLNIQETQNGVGRANALYHRSQGDLSHIYKESGDYIGEKNKEISQEYALDQAANSKAQAALQQQLAANGQSNGGAAGNELSRLGLGGAQGTMGQFSADQVNAQNVAAQTGANNAANLTAMNLGSSNIGNLLLGMNAGGRASAMGLARNTHDDSVASLRQNRQDVNDQVRQAVEQAHETRPDLVKQLLSQMAQSGWAQYVQGAQLSLQQHAAHRAAAAARASKRKAAASKSSGGSSGSSHSTSHLSSHSSGSSSSGNSSTSSTYSDAVNLQLSTLFPKRKN